MAEPQQALSSVAPPKAKSADTVVAVAASAPSPDAAVPNKRRWILAAIIVVAAVVAARMWWRAHYFEVTDNAYLEGNVSLVSPRIAGTVSKVLMKDNQRVRVGELLAELDQADYQIKVDQILAQIAEVDAQIKQVDAQIAQTQAESASTQAQVLRAAAQSSRALSDAQRYTALYADDMKAVSKQELDTAIANRDSAASDWRAQQELALASKAKLAAVSTSRQTWLAQRQVLQTQLQDARLQLGYNKIYAPVSGRVGKKNVEVGARVQPGQQVLAIVQDGVWVTANFKETQLADLAPGQEVHVRIDALPDHAFVGHVDSFSPASGAHFSLLPPDNATGNFTKIVQRIPVKILLDPASVQAFAERLAPGMSVMVEIDLRQRGHEPAADHVAQH